MYPTGDANLVQYWYLTGDTDYVKFKRVCRISYSIGRRLMSHVILNFLVQTYCTCVKP